MKRFLVYQIEYTHKLTSNVNNIGVGVNIRNIGAESEEEAIGKFVKNVKERSEATKLNIECFPLVNLTKID